MGYLHIQNLYHKDGQDILLFKECFALEKIHGTSSHLAFEYLNNDNIKISYFSGGTKYNTFIGLFNEEELKKHFLEMALPVDKKLIIYGESYGAKEQGMSNTYGILPKFIAFDVKINDCWLNVPNAENIVKKFGLEFVHYVKIPTDIKFIDEQRDAPSVQAIKNGISMIIPEGADFNCPSGTPIVSYGTFGDRIANPRKREGVVLRPLIEFIKPNGCRVICKHKANDFRETKTPRTIDLEKQKLFEGAELIAEEYVTYMRLKHVLDKIPNHSMERMKDIINAMIEDVNREGDGEFEKNILINKAIGKKTALLYKDYLNSILNQST